jgi:hypothetical protein
MKPNTERTRVGSRSQGRIDAEPFFGKRHIALAVALLASLAASAPAQTGGGSGEPYHTILPVRTRVIAGAGLASCNQYSVVVNGVWYHCPDGSLSGFNIVAFKRQPVADANGRETLGLYKYATIHTDTGKGLQEVKDYLHGLLNDSNAPKDLLVIVSTLGQVGGDTREIAQELEAFGATTEFRDIGYPEFAFSFIGIKGLKKGQAYQVGGDGVLKNPRDLWSLNGYFAKDSKGRYAFIEPDYVQFQLTPGTGMIKVGDHEYPASRGAKDGIHVLAVDRAHPDIVSDDTVYSLQSLPDFSNDGSILYFITSVGNPFSQPPSPAQRSGALKMQTLGATYELFADASHSDAYSLVGAVSSKFDVPPYAAAESGSLLPGDPKPTGKIRGVLQRQRRGNFFSPIASGGNLDFYSILSQEPVLFPHPVPGDDAEQKAFTAIAEDVLRCGDGCNPRNAYWNLNPDIDGWKSTLESASSYTYPNGPSVDCHDSPKAPYCVVRSQLLTEFQYVGNIHNFDHNLSQLWSANQSNNIFKLLQVAQDIQKDLLPNQQKPANGVVDAILRGLLGLGGAVAPQPIGAILSVTGTVLSFGANLANNEAGDREVIDITTTVGNLEKQAVDSFNDQQAAQGAMFRFIYQDWGKIQALGSKLNDADDPNWAWGTDTTAQILARMSPVTEVSYYRSILPTAYAVGEIHNSKSSNPTDYVSSVSSKTLSGFSTCDAWYPFSKYLNPEQYLSSTEIDHTNLWDVQPLGRRDIKDGGCNVHNDKKDYQAPSEKILNRLFADLAVYKPDFYRHWEFPRATCDPKGVDSNYRESTGCDWAGAKPNGQAITAVIAPDSTASPQLNPRASTSLDTEEASMSPGSEGSPLSYSWQVLGGEAAITDGDTATPSVEFTSGLGSYVVRVTITDSNGRSSTGETTVVYEEQ